MYITSDHDDPDWVQSMAFKRAFSINVEIEFVGVWSVFDLSLHICLYTNCANNVRDTVNSVGLIPRRLPFTQIDNNIKYFRHALSLDERRVWADISFVVLKKKPHCRELVASNPVHGTAQQIMLAKMISRAMRCLAAKATISTPTAPLRDGCDIRNTCIQKPRERLTLKKCGLPAVIAVRASIDGFQRTILMSIFSDIGGGSVKNRTRNSLARIPLRWMIRQCFIAGTGIMFHKDTLLKVGLDPDTLCDTQVHLPRPPMIFQDPKVHPIPVPEPTVLDDDRKAVVYTDGDSFVNEEEEDLADALCPMYDELKRRKLWWILECVPQSVQYQESSETNKIVRKFTYVDLHFVSLCVNGYSLLSPFLPESIKVVLVMWPCKRRMASRYTELSKFERKPKG
jgi:hypothetical protein